jgi:iron complex outermembrane receptor protein
MRKNHIALALAVAFPVSFSAVFPVAAQTGPQTATPATPAASDAPVKSLGTVTVNSDRPTSLPTQIPTTIEGVVREQIEQTVNAFDAEDALKYLPSLNVRKRYIGDYNHAVLASRASGTDRSARSLVFADGIPLSNLLGNGAFYTPRWGLVTPEEIERVDVLYGPYSAAYSGNSVGAVVDYQTRMPTRFEAHAKIGFATSNYQQYGTDGTFSGNQASASLGNKNGNWSWFVNVNRLDSQGQPLVFPAKLVSSGAVSTAGTPVSGAILNKNPQNADWLTLGATTQYDTVQEHAKVKVAYDFSPTVRASYTLGWWGNTADSTGVSYLSDNAGNAVYSGDININGRKYTLAPTDISTNRSRLEHVIHGLSVKSHTKKLFDWEVAASLYDYVKVEARSPTVALPAALGGGAGRITDLGGSGWNTLALKGTWRPDHDSTRAHVVDFGLQQEAYHLRTLVSNTSHWISGAAAARVSAFNGNTTLQSLYAQDHWKFAPDWNVTLGGRLERWRAYGGEIGNATQVLGLGERTETAFSPKLAIAYQLTPVWALKAASGRAVRMPTVAELYQGSIASNVIVNNDPNLKPERSWSTEFTAERDLGNGLWRTTVFHEDTQDALYSQTNFNVMPNITNIQNVDSIRTVGLEMAYSASDVGIRGLDLSASLTYADAKITANANNPASVGKRAPRVPDWRASFVATYKPGAQWSTTLGVRYSGEQFGQLDNSDTNGSTYQGVSSYLVADVRARYQFAKQWSASFGIDNLNNATYWAFHPYTQRTYVAELKFDL